MRLSHIHTYTSLSQIHPNRSSPLLVTDRHPRLGRHLPTSTPAAAAGRSNPKDTAATTTTTTLLSIFPNLAACLMRMTSSMRRSCMEVDAICQKHARSTAKKEKKAELTDTKEMEAACSDLSVPLMMGTGLGSGKLDEAFLREVEAICEERAARHAAKTKEQPKEMEEMEEEDGSVPRKYYEYLVLQ